MPPTVSSLLSAPSILTLPPRPSCPSVEITTVSVLVGSKLGAGALPGISSDSSRKLRPLRGSESICCELMTPSTSELVLFTRSPVSAELMLMLTCSAFSCRWNFRSCCCAVVELKPLAEMLTSYSPGESAFTMNRPAPLVVAVRPMPVALLFTFTSAPVTAAPEGSLTSPLRIAEPKSCAKAEAAHSNAARNITPHLFFNFATPYQDEMRIARYAPILTATPRQSPDY